MLHLSWPRVGQVTRLYEIAFGLAVAVGTVALVWAVFFLVIFGCLFVLEPIVRGKGDE